MCNKTDVPDIEHAVRKRRLKIAGAHAGCLAVARRLGLLPPALRRDRHLMRSVR